MRNILISGLLFMTIHNGFGIAIAASDDRILVSGTQYISQNDSGLRFQRHREDILQLPRKELGLNPDKARNTSGIVLSFSTDSKNIIARFRILSANYMGSAFGIFENEKLIREFKYNPQTKSAELEFESQTDGAALFEIALPSFSNVEFEGIEIDDDAQLLKFEKPSKPIYVALGDSITHGVGQEGTTHKTWPFLLSRRLDAELFNLAVGGGKISVPTGRMLEDWNKIDLITILIGYNDLHFDKKTPEQYRAKYNELLDTIRENHPETRIYCISMLYTKQPANEETGVNANAFRQSLADLVKQRQKTDARLCFIEGDKITSEKNLRADKPQDPVHLGVDGAAQLADALFTIIETRENE